MKVREYKVTCLKCKSYNLVPIDEDSRQILWKHTDRIVSGRYRLDNQWGFQCICQNSDIMTEQEKKMIADPTNPKPQELSSIIKNLQPQKPMFKMELLNA